MAFGFSMLILMGTVLLMLPVSSKNGNTVFDRNVHGGFVNLCYGTCHG